MTYFSPSTTDDINNCGQLSPTIFVWHSQSRAIHYFDSVNRLYRGNYLGDKTKSGVLNLKRIPVLTDSRFF